VHPTKSEVRWRDSNYIHGQVLAALREKFLATNLDHSLQTQTRENEAYRERVRSAMVDFFTSATPKSRHEGTARSDEATLRLRSGQAPRRSDGGRGTSRSEGAERSDEATERRSDEGAFRLAGLDAGHALPYGGAIEPPAGEPQSAIADADSAISDSQSTIRTPHSAIPESESAIRTPQSAMTPRTLQVHDTFIVVETGEGLMIVDQHALHERILYEQFRARIAEKPLESQRLLLPEVVRVPADRIEALETHAEVLGRLGIELTASGPQSVTLHAFPSFLERVDRVRFVKDLLDLLGEQGTRPTAETLLHELLDMMACKAAVKAGDPLSAEEIDALLKNRELAERSSHCPHGRPTTLHLTLRDLERQFKRR
jgi:DNA mismatch repair protein MutL